MRLQAPKGTVDIYGKEMKLWAKMENTIHSLCHTFGAEEIRTPMYENTDIFQRGVGDTTDIVQKEMFTFEDQGGRSITLRPENTAAVMRAYSEHGIHNQGSPTKMYYIGPMFRAENPQKGRQRQFNQFGIEYIGVETPEADGEVIAMTYLMMKNLGLKDATIRINSIGSPESRQKYNERIIAEVEENPDKFCDLCKERAHRNALRVIDCKNESCQEQIKHIPSILTFLDEEDTNHFEAVQAYLDRREIPYVVDDKIVRGLDYYVKTVFEIHVDTIGAQSALGGGGRYDGLMESLGGTVEAPGVGFAIGLERVVLALQAQGIWDIDEREHKIFLGFIGDAGKEKAEDLVYALRKEGIKADIDLMDRSVRAQMRYADRINARYSSIIGDNEVEDGKITIKDMYSGEEEEVAFSNLSAFMKGE